MPSVLVIGFPGEILFPTNTTRRASTSSLATASSKTESIPSSSPGGRPGEQVIQRQHGVGLAAAEIRLELNDGVASSACEAADGPNQQTLQAFRQIRSPEELDGVSILVGPFTQVHLPEIGGELGLLVPPARDVRVRGDDFPPGLQAGRGGAFNRRSRLLATLPARLFVEADAQELHLEPVHFRRLGRRYGCQQSVGRVEGAVSIVTGERFLMRPSVAVSAQLADETSLRRSENRAKDVIPGFPHQLEQAGGVPVGHRTITPARVVDESTQGGRIEAVLLDRTSDLAVDERPQTRFEQIERLADPFVVGRGHSSLSPVLLGCNPDRPLAMPRTSIRPETADTRGQGTLLQVLNRDIAPVSMQILGYQTAMTVMRPVLATEQAPILEQLRRDGGLDVPLGHQMEELVLVLLPGAAVFLEGVQHRLGRREHRKMHVVDPADSLKKICEILLLGESGEL